MTAEAVHGVHHFKLDLKGKGPSILFSQATTPQGTLEVPDFKSFGEDGTPINSVGGGTQCSWAPISLTRGVDKDHTLWDWFQAVKTKGVVPGDTKMDIELQALDSGNAILHTWNIKGAVITQYGHSGANAQTMEILVNTVQIKYEDAELVPA
jgi:phage tail-like protein